MSKPKADPAPAFAALGDPTRLALVAKLAGGVALSIAALSADAGMTRQGVAKHLRVLAAAELVVGTTAGRETRYALDPTRLAALRDYLAEVAAQWDDALARLKAFVED